MNDVARCALILGAACLLAFSLPCPGGRILAAEEAVWQPSQTRAFLISLTRFKGDRLHSFTSDDRLDDAFVELLKQRGVPASQIVLLKDELATTQNIKREFASFLQQSKPGEMLFFYFGSHGAYDPRTGHFSFCAFNDNLSFAWAVDAIESDFKGTHAFLTTDCCYSGGMVDLVEKRKSAIAYACLSSTHAHQTAWSGWRFMQCLMRGLAGDPVVDLDANGNVGLDELAAYTARYMAFAAEGKPMFNATADFNPKLRLATAQGPKGARAGELLEARSGTKWAKAEILAARGDQFKIHFTENTRTATDAWVSQDRLRPFAVERYPSGFPVEVRASSDNKRHSARVLDRWESLHLCRVEDRSPAYDEWFGPSRTRALLAGNWSGKWNNDQGESGPESLALRAEGDLLEGTWSGNVKLTGERLAKDTFLFEASTPDRSYRCAGRVKDGQLRLDYCAQRPPGHGHYYGWATLAPQDAVKDVWRDADAEFAGPWTGTYENSRAGTGVETLNLAENSGRLQGIWSGVDVSGERLGSASFYLQGKLGQRTYRVLGHVAKGELELTYSATAGNERYIGWSTLKR